MAREYKYTSDFAELRDVSYHPQPKPADLAADVLDGQARQLCVNIDQLREALNASRLHAERLGEAFDCHPGELPRVGKSLSGAMARIAKCVDKVRANDDEIADAVEQLSEWRNKMRARLDDCDSKLTAMRVALSKAGIPEVEKYHEVPADPYERSLCAGGRVLGGVERIERLQYQRDEARAEVKGLREHIRIMRGASQEAYDRLMRERDDTGRKLYEAHQERDRLREELDALRAAKLGAMLTPLEAVKVDDIGPCMRRAHFLGFEIEHVRSGSGYTSSWCVRVGKGTTYMVNYPSPAFHCAARGDVNAILARYGYVLEQWL